MTTEEMKDNIQNGIIWLNENRPGWQDKVRRKIEAGEFDMVFPCDCVIGATDGSFDEVFDVDGEEMDSQAIELGFALPFTDDENESDKEYHRLTQLWIEAINDL